MSAEHRLETIDMHQFDRRGAGAAYLLRGERTALVETGTAASSDRLATRLRGKRLAYLFVTHVHLDHAGGAGTLVAEHPEAVVIVHHRGAPHLADPSRLIAGARGASPDLFPLYGEPRPVPERQIVPAADGDTFDLGGGIVVDVVETPGHAPHHLCFFERSERILFCGDAVGNHGTPVDTPLTVPPRFDLAGGLDTLSRLMALRPRVLAFTHFGTTTDAAAILAGYSNRLVAWFDRIEKLSRGRSPDEVVAAVLADRKYVSLCNQDRMLVEMCVRGALLSAPAAAA